MPLRELTSWLKAIYSDSATARPLPRVLLSLPGPESAVSGFIEAGHDFGDAAGTLVH